MKTLKDFTKEIHNGDVLVWCEGHEGELKFRLTIVCVEAAEGSPTDWSIFRATHPDHLLEALPPFLERSWPDKLDKVYEALRELDLGFERPPTRGITRRQRRLRHLSR